MKTRSDIFHEKSFYRRFIALAKTEVKKLGLGFDEDEMSGAIMIIESDFVS